MLKSFSGPFVATLFISMFVLIMQFLWRQIDEIVGKGLDFSVILELLFYASMTLLPMAFPLAVLLSSIMTFGSLGENYELIALKSAGISLYRIMRPLIVCVVMLSIFAFFFANNVLPVANLKFYSLMYDVKKQKPEMSFKEGIFSNDLEGYSIKIDKINKETGMMYDMLIYNHKDVSGNYEVTKADSGTMDTDNKHNKMELILYNGYTYTDEGLKNSASRNNFPFRRVKFDKQKILLELPGTDLKRTGEDGFRSHSLMLDIEQLNYTIDSLQKALRVRKTSGTQRLLSSNYVKNKASNTNRDSILLAESRGMINSVDSLYRTYEAEEQKRAVDNALQYAREVKQRTQDDMTFYLAQEESVRKHEIQWHEKFTWAFACIVFFFIGAPLGAIIRKGGLGMPVVVSTLLFIGYYVIFMMGRRSATEGVIEPWVGMWIATGIMLILGIFLTYKSVTDSEMMSSEAYLNFFKKIRAFFKRKQNKEECKNIV